MKPRTLYLLPLLLLLAACSGNDEGKILYPSKLKIGSTTHDFHYDLGRVYSVTTSRPNFYEEVIYSYYDDYFNDPEHRFKDEIFDIHYHPDNGPIGWDRSDSVKSKQEMLMRSDDGLLAHEDQIVYMVGKNQEDHIRHKYDADGRLSESIYYIFALERSRAQQLDDEQYIAKRIKYSYSQGKLTNVAYYGLVSDKPYLQIELSYDDMPGFLSSLPLEARFQPQELPYRNHNITGYTVKDRHGKVREDLSYTCSYTYNRHGYPTRFTRTMLDGQQVKGEIAYKTKVGELKRVASAE